MRENLIKQHEQEMARTVKSGQSEIKRLSQRYRIGTVAAAPVKKWDALTIEAREEARKLFVPSALSSYRDCGPENGQEAGG